MSNGVSRIKKTWLALIAAACALAGFGYVTAKVAQPTVEREVREYVLSKGITGIAFGGKTIPPQEIPISARVKWPFVVVVSYAVPFDLHTSYHRSTYLVLPWGRYLLSKENSYPV